MKFILAAMILTGAISASADSTVIAKCNFKLRNSDTLLSEKTIEILKGDAGDLFGEKLVRFEEVKANYHLIVHSVDGKKLFIDIRSVLEGEDVVYSWTGGFDLVRNLTSFDKITRSSVDVTCKSNL